MLLNDALTLIETRVAGLVHDSVADGAPERIAHERFILSRLFAGLIGLACLPPFLTWHASAAPIDALAALCAAGPAFAAFWLSRSGRLVPAHAIASVALAGLAVCLSLSSPAAVGPAVVLLLAVPLDAVLSGSRRCVAVAAGIALAAAGIIAAMQLADVADAPAWPPRAALAFVALAGLAHLNGQVLAHSEGLLRSASMSRALAAHDNSLLQAIDDLVTWHDANGSVLKASAGATKLLGAPGLALHGRGLLAHVHVSDRPAFLKAVSDAASSDDPVVVQFRLHKGAAAGRRAVGPVGAQPAQQVVWAEMRAHRIGLGAPGDHAVVAVTRDVSAHYSHAQELEAARARAETADGAKGRFLATVSHELRTPLNAIIGFSEVLGGEMGPTLSAERRDEYAAIIHASGLHLLGVVNTLLDMSKIEAGEFDFAPEPIDAAAATHGCCDLMQLKAEQGGVAMERDIAANLPELVADPRAYRQVLINLLSNALKFTPAGGRITVSARRDGHHLRLAVADNGIGIPEDDLPRVGDPFFQCGSSYDRRHEGTGLGLSVVRGLLGLHGGTLAIESAPGEGTTVTVMLPLDCRTGEVRARPVTVRATVRAARRSATPFRRSA